MKVDYDSFSPFWLLIDKKLKVLDRSVSFSEIKKGSKLIDHFSLTKPKIELGTKDIYSKLSDKILEFNHSGFSQKFRATAHQIDKDIFLVCWPVFSNLDSIQESPFRKEMLHHACSLMDTLIIKDILNKTQKKTRDIHIDKMKAEHLKKVSDEFLANMSHEIRTPLNGLLGIIQLLKETNLDDEQLNMVDIMSVSGNTLLNVINDILDISKIESGKMKIESTPINLRTLLRNCVNLMASRTIQKDLSVQVLDSPEMDHIYLGDPTRILQILNNYVSNAIKFTRKGEIKIYVESKPIDEETVNIRINVQDSGIGINKENQSKLFNAFVQADSSTTREFGGTGLGLFISSKLAKLMQGKVDFTSEFGVGSTFFVEIPLKKIQEEGSKSSDSSHQKLNTKKANYNAKALIVDDNQQNQIISSLMLKKFGISSEVCFSGKEAIELIEKDSFDIIFMDIQMADMDGHEATKKIIEKLGDDTPPIIALSASVMEEDKVNSLKSGMKDFLSKPLEIEGLQIVLSNFLKANS